jgi:hypothetical protein
VSRRPPTKRAFISFDYDNDDDLRVLLVGQARNPDSPFEIADWSVKERLRGDWKEKVRAIIRRVDVVVVICGNHTDTASGVSAELQVAQEEKKPYFLLAGRKTGTIKKPTAARSGDKLYRWAWDNLKKLIHGAR